MLPLLEPPLLDPMIRPFSAATAIDTGDVGPELGGEIIRADVEPAAAPEEEPGTEPALLFAVESRTIDNRLIVASLRGDASKISAFSRTMTLSAAMLICLVLISPKTFPGVPITTWAAITGRGSAFGPPRDPYPPGICPFLPPPP